VGYIKGHFFVRYRAFESWEHLNQLAERWLAEEADRRVHGTLKEVVIERFAREAPALGPLPPQRYDTSYCELRHVTSAGMVMWTYGGTATASLGELAGSSVAVRIGLEGLLRVYQGDRLVASHLLRSAGQGWVTVPEHHASL